MPEDEGGPADPVDVFRGGVCVGGNNLTPKKALFRYASWRRGSARCCREETSDRASQTSSVFYSSASYTSNRPPPHGQGEVV